MYVDSKKVSKWTQNIEFVDWKPPEILEILSPRYVKVQDLVTFNGKLYTNMYGNTKEQNGDSLDTADAAVEIASTFVGPKECEMVRFQNKLLPPPPDISTSRYNPNK